MSSLHSQIVHRNPEAAALDAMLRWAKPYQSAIYRVVLTLTGNEADADGVLLETIHNAWNRFVRHANQRPSILDVLQIAVRESVMVLRSHAGDLAGWIEEPESEIGNIPVTTIEWEANPETLFAPREWKKIRELALESLTPMDRTVFLLRDVLRFTAAETAELIDRPEVVVKVRLTRARLRLREFLNPLCRKVRAEGIALVRAFGFPSLQSAQV